MVSALGAGHRYDAVVNDQCRQVMSGISMDETGSDLLMNAFETWYSKFASTLEFGTDIETVFSKYMKEAAL